MDEARSSLAEQVSDVAEKAFEGALLTKVLKTRGFAGTTRYVKQVFGRLGRRLDFYISAAGCTYAHEGEWMYDMVWYTMRDGLLTQQAMVLECELKPGEGPVAAAGEVDGDFQKLVQARADVRVWFSLLPNAELSRQHLLNCRKQVERFSGSVAGDMYMFIIYNWTTRATSVERYTAGAR